MVHAAQIAVAPATFDTPAVPTVEKAATVAPVADPVRTGLARALNRPAGNITGVAALTIELDPRQFGAVRA
jgi:hypothetical protein